MGPGRVEKCGEGSPLQILSATQEIVVGDRLIKVPPERIINYPPHAPQRDVSGRVIAMPSSLLESGRDAVIALDVGGRTASRRPSPYSPGLSRGDRALPSEAVPEHLVVRVRAPCSRQEMKCAGGVVGEPAPAGAEGGCGTGCGCHPVPDTEL